MLQFVLDYHRACVVPVAAAEHYCAGGAERCQALVVGSVHAPAKNRWPLSIGVRQQSELRQHKTPHRNDDGPRHAACPTMAALAAISSISRRCVICPVSELCSKPRRDSRAACPTMAARHHGACRHGGCLRKPRIRTRFILQFAGRHRADCSRSRNSREGRHTHLWQYSQRAPRRHRSMVSILVVA